jgi:hypothetical protein
MALYKRKKTWWTDRKADAKLVDRKLQAWCGILVFGARCREKEKTE